MGNWNAVLKNWTPKTKTFIIRKLELVLPKSEGFDIENWISVSKIELLERLLSKSKSGDKSDFGWRKYARTLLLLLLVLRELLDFGPALTHIMLTPFSFHFEKH